MIIHSRIRLAGAAALASLLAVAVAAPVSAQTTETVQAGPLTLKVYNSSEAAFAVNSVVILGAKEAILVDTQFSRADLLRVAAEVLESGRKLTTVYVTHWHPDHSFGVAELKQLFPDARMVTPPVTVARLKKDGQGKIDLWGPKLGANAPRGLAIPDELTSGELVLEGRKIEVLGPLQGDDETNSALWIPSTRTLIAGDLVFNRAHAWTADSNADGRKAWIAALDRLAALKPEVVVGGHGKPGAPHDASAVAETRRYLEAFGVAAAKAKTSAEIISAMKQAFPDHTLGIALELGAKVATGEIKW